MIGRDFAAGYARMGFHSSCAAGRAWRDCANLRKAMTRATVNGNKSLAADGTLSRAEGARSHRAEHNHDDDHRR